MLNAIKNSYKVTNIFLNNVSGFVSIRVHQGAFSSVYIFIIFINGLSGFLRDSFTPSNIFGSIHFLVLANDTLVLAESIGKVKSKNTSTYCFFGIINQNVNICKSKYIYLVGHGITKEGIVY